MSKQKKYLTIFYWIILAFGVYKTIFLTVFMSVMATDSPSSTSVHAILGGLVGFSITFIPTVLVPFLAIKELKNYTEKKKLTFNYVFSVIILFYFLPSVYFFATLFSIKLPQNIFMTPLNIIQMGILPLISMIICFWQPYVVYKIKTSKDETNSVSDLD